MGSRLKRAQPSFIYKTAYVLIHFPATIGLRRTKWTHVPFNTLQNRLLKVACLRLPVRQTGRMLGRQAGRVCELKTKINFHLPTAFSLKQLYGKILYNLATGFHNPSTC